jgi:hypothetical protein
MFNYDNLLRTYLTHSLSLSLQEILKGKYHCTIDLLFDWFGISRMKTDNFCLCLKNRLIQTSQTGGQWYSDTSSFSIPCSLSLSLTHTHTHIYIYL